MRRHYDFSTGLKNPYATKPKRSVTIRLDEHTIAYFKRMAEELDVRYQTLVNLYLRDCASSRRRLSLEWRAPRRGPS